MSDVQLGQFGIEIAPHVEPLVRALTLAKIGSGTIRVNLCPHMDAEAPDSQRVICIPCPSLNAAADILRSLARYLSPDEYAEVGPPLLIRRDTPEGKMQGFMIFTKAIGKAVLN
jgi:hypothetical protein